MSHRSLPPSASRPGALNAASLLRMIRPTSGTMPMEAAPPAEASSPRVQVFPSANGTVLISGVTLSGQWVAEYRCLAEDYDQRCVDAMERKVIKKERQMADRLEAHVQSTRPTLTLVADQ